RRTRARERHQERLCVEAEAISELREADGAVQDVGKEGEDRGERDQADGGIAAHVAQTGEAPQECGRREEERHTPNVEREQPRRTLVERRRLQKDRIEMTRQVEEREDPVREEDITFRETRISRVERRVPAHEVVRDV